MTFTIPGSSTQPPLALAWQLPLLCLSLLLLKALHNRYLTGLNAYPGPPLAGTTNLWRLGHSYLHRHSPPLLSLHEKYGSIVRLGPRCLSFADPAAIASFNKMEKSEFYPVSAASARGQYIYTLFSGIDARWHDRLRKSVNWIFTPQAVASYETLVDQTLVLFLREVGRRFAAESKGGGGKEGMAGGGAGAAATFDLSEWFAYFTFDFIGDLTYNRRYGFLQEGRDVDGIIKSLAGYITYGAFLGQAPLLDRFLRHNVVFMWLERYGISLRSVFPGVPFTRARLQERREYDARNDGQDEKQAFRKGINPEDAEANHEDLLDRFNRAKVDHPDIVTDSEVQSMCLTMLFAGAETTGITLSATLYYLLRHPRCCQELRKELDAHLPADNQSTQSNYEAAAFNTVRRIRFSETHKLPYLTACIQETFRVHAAFSTMIERVTPREGATICGNFVPGGTIVGANAWVVHRNQEIFGEDVDVYRPERWLVDDGEKVKRMNRSLYQFGGGSHTCLGKHISYLEIYKMVPSLLAMYEIELEDPKKELTMTNGLNMRISDLRVRIQPRQQS